ncbi:hypothetical protein SM033_00062 [Vibrio phage vB_VpaM_sm033]|nr:hypothetical protein SM033_00062 [Vibrio phage vB_VpaM_sm033]
MEMKLSYTGEHAMAVMFHLDGFAFHIDSMSELSQSRVMSESEHVLTREVCPTNGFFILDQLITALAFRLVRNHDGVKSFDIFQSGEYISLHANDGSEHRLRFEFTSCSGPEVHYETIQNGAVKLTALFETFYADAGTLLVLTYTDTGSSLVEGNTTSYFYRDVDKKVDYSMRGPHGHTRMMRVFGKYDPEVFPRIPGLFCMKLDLDVGGNGTIYQIGPENRLLSTIEIKDIGDSTKSLEFVRKPRNDNDHPASLAWSVTVFGDERGYKTEWMDVKASAKTHRVLVFND